MEAIDNLSSKIVGGFDYFIHSYLMLFFAVIAIVGIVMYLGNIPSSNDLSNSPFSDTTSASSTGTTILQIIVVVIIVIILLWLLTHVIKRLFGINIIQTIKNIFSNQRFNNVVDSIDDKIEDMEYSLLNYLDKTKDDSDSDDDEDNINDHGTGVGDTGPSLTNDSSPLHDSSTHKHGEEVFNVSNNKYTYKDAKSICKAYNARLATYSEVENAYNAGGEWCNYGWSENQLALFPTQQNTYDKLQKIKGHENDCGRPGVNGGFLDESLKFGVNCYGVKPDMDEKEEQLMKLERLYPKTKSEVELEKQVEYWKEHLDDITVSPFNHDKWNRI
jgi:hypothetical protein